MLGSGEQGVVLLAICVALTGGLGCGGTDESTQLPPGAAGSAGAGSGGSAGSSSAGGQAAAELVERALSSTRKLCEQIAECYPDLQTPGSPSCIAPASGDRKISFQNPGVDPNLRALLEKCFAEYPDQAELSAWVNCAADVGRVNAECYSSCPADGETCVNAGNAALALCDTPTIKAQLNACYKAG